MGPTFCINISRDKHKATKWQKFQLNEFPALENGETSVFVSHPSCTYSFLARPENPIFIKVDENVKSPV